jgi:hypothetical protein
VLEVACRKIIGRPPRRQDPVRGRGQPLQHEQQDAGAKARRTRRALPRTRR